MVSPAERGVDVEIVEVPSDDSGSAVLGVLGETDGRLATRAARVTMTATMQANIPATTP